LMVDAGAAAAGEPGPHVAPVPVAAERISA
jgi:hypothetical protein